MNIELEALEMLVVSFRLNYRLSGASGRTKLNSDVSINKDKARLVVLACKNME